MTGYGRQQANTDNMDIIVEIKSVNHRFLEVSPKVPRNMLFLEDKLKTLINEKISRGKVDVFLTLNTSEVADTSVEINHSFAKPYVAALKTLAKEYHVKNDISVSMLAATDNIFKITKTDIDKDLLWEKVKTVAEGAIADFIAMRETEGAKLKDDVLSRIDNILKKVEYIEGRSPETVKEYRARLEQKMRELLSDKEIDEQRLITETAIMADKLAVSEETVRLRSHLGQLGSVFELDEPIGRKLDFIVQEINRETNTIGSKAQDVNIAQTVVDMKTEIEKIREQIQNIE